MKVVKRFSLVELFFVAALLGVVTSMITPAIERTTDAAKDSICKNNLSGIYRAAMVYVDDNNSILMGPSWSAQRPHIRRWDNKRWFHHFPKYLRHYMPTTKAEDGTTYNAAFMCPFNSEKEMQGRQQLYQRSHYRSTRNPWVKGELLYGRPRSKKRKPQSIYFISRPSKKDLMVDSDLDNTPWLERINTDNSLIPVHGGTYRNNLYFDGNINAVDWTPETN